VQRLAASATEGTQATGDEQKPIPMRALQLSREAELASVSASGDPWSSNWVFGGKQPAMIQELMKQGSEAKMPSRLDAESLKKLEGNAIQSELKGLLAQAQAAADAAETQVTSEALASRSISNLQDQVGSAQGTIESLSIAPPDDSARRALSSERGGTPHSWSGADFLMAAGASQVGSSRGEQQSSAGGQRSFNSSNEFSPASEKSPIRKSEIDPLKGRPLTAFEQQIAAAGSTPKPETVATIALTGHVVQGAMARERLSSQSLAGLSEGIRSAQVQGGGNIKIRLNPDHLGEIRLEVATVGNRVGLKIQASDAKAKSVIEESMKYLRDSLGSLDLNLSKVDVSVAPQRSSTDSAFSMDQRATDQGGWNAYQQQSESRQSQGSREDRGPWSERGAVRGLTQAQSNAVPARAAAAGRLDVMV
jgi:flagellar hook-length control protein FliK